MSSFQELINSDQPVLVDFFAEWCGPCKAMAPILEETKNRIGETAKIIKVDVDRNPQAAGAFQVRAVPTMIMFKKGEVVWKHAGMVGANELVALFEKHK